MKMKKTIVTLAPAALIFAALTIWGSSSSDARNVKPEAEPQTVSDKPIPGDVQPGEAEPMTCTEKLKFCCPGYCACRKEGHIQKCDDIWNSCNKGECSGSAAFNCKC